MIVYLNKLPNNIINFNDQAPALRKFLLIAHSLAVSQPLLLFPDF